MWTIGNLIDHSFERVLLIFESDFFQICMKNPFINKYKTQILIDLAFILKISSKIIFPPGNSFIVIKKKNVYFIVYVKKMKKMIHFAIIIFMECEQLEGKLNGLKALNNICMTYRENSQMRALILNEICFKGKSDFLKGLILLTRSFLNKLDNFALYFLNIINLCLNDKERIQVKLKKSLIL